jgi:alpha-amylase
MVPGKSQASFVDHFYDGSEESTALVTGNAAERGDFMTGAYDYKIKKSPESVKAVLRRQGALLIDERQYPLVVEKAFGLRESVAEYSFAYQLVNQSLASYSFIFAVELTLALPGAPLDRAHLRCGRTRHRGLVHNRVLLEEVTSWSLHDAILGSAIGFVTHKPVNVLCTATGGAENDHGDYQGTTLVMYSPVSLEENGVWSLVGKMDLKKLRRTGGMLDAV